jgi:hypothetical protein
MKGNHMTRLSKILLVAACLALGASLNLLRSQPAPKPQPNAVPAVPPAVTPNADWIQGSEDEKFKLVSKHLRGFDATMVEVGYRYTELFWAGHDENWEFAAYQLEKIRHTIELGMERRPKRAASAGPFLTNAIPMMKQSIEKKDSSQFEARFKLLTLSCNTCHSMEKMPFVQVHPPEQRHSPVRFQKK